MSLLKNWLVTVPLSSPSSLKIRATRIKAISQMVHEAASCRRKEMMHFDNVVSKMTKTNETRKFGQYVASYLGYLAPAGSVMTRTEVQNTVSKVVLEYLSSQQHETRNVHPFHSSRTPSREPLRYPFDASSNAPGPPYSANMCRSTECNYILSYLFCNITLLSIAIAYASNYTYHSVECV